MLEVFHVYAALGTATALLSVVLMGCYFLLKGEPIEDGDLVCTLVVSLMCGFIWPTIWAGAIMLGAFLLVSLIVGTVASRTR